MKPVDSLEIADLNAHPVWVFSKAGKCDVYPVKRLPVKNLGGKLVATEVCLANGNKIWALLGNVQPGDARLTEHFLTLSVLNDHSWFHLARYHDFDYQERGPEALALFLGIPVAEVFPIYYNITDYVIGDPKALSGSIPKEPCERLTRSQIIALAVS